MRYCLLLRTECSDIALEDSGEGDTQDIMKYEVYTKMLAEWFDEPVDQAKNKAMEFEKQVKKLFVEEPGRMKLLLWLTNCSLALMHLRTYLYIDKSMQDGDCSTIAESPP